MHNIRKISLLFAALAIGFLSAPSVRAQSVGNCEPSIGEAYLDINNVRARIPNNGELFYRGSPDVYEVPKGSGLKAIFASGIWMGGQVAGQLRLAGTTYGPYEFWSGPLNDDGSSPANCLPWDRVWKISKDDINELVGGGSAAPDLLDWPTGLGAPTLDANGESIDLTSQPLASRVDRKINLAAGERPAILGDQMLWWIMNDKGNQHNRSSTPPMGVEVHGSAFAFNTAGALGNTTFYKYRIQYKGSVPLENTYMGVFSDPDLGAAFDDYVGSDSTLGMGYIYNADNDDDGNYGAAPPAAGYDFFQGPLVDDNSKDDNRDGTVDEPGERLKMTSFAFYSNGGGIQGDPGNGADMYNYMRGRWKDGQPFTLGGNGLGFSTIETKFMFPGMPPNYWSEYNSDNNGSAIPAADRRFVLSTGPFTVKPNDEQTIIFGIVTSFGADNIDSVRKMKSDDVVAQAAFDINFVVPSPPNAPRVTTTSSDGSILLEWGYRATDNNYLDSYNVEDPFCSETDCDYAFEGYKVYQYANSTDQDGVVIATFDRANGVTKVIDTDGGDLLIVTANGTDSGVAHSMLVSGLTNYSDYQFGLQAYAYNFDSYPKAYHGPIARVTAIPQKTSLVISPEAVAAASAGTGIDGVGAEGNIGNGGTTIHVVNAAAITGHAYKVEFFTAEVAGKGNVSFVGSNDSRDVDNDASFPDMLNANKSGVSTVVTYDVTDVNTGAKVFDGAQVAASAGIAGPEGVDVLQFDGLSLDVAGAPDGFLSFRMVANGGGAIDQAAAFDFQGFPVEGRPDGAQQVTNGGQWGIHTGRGAGQNAGYAEFLNRTILGRGGWGNIMPYDFEVRFTQACYDGWRAAFDAGEAIAATPSPTGCYGYDRFSALTDDGNAIMYLPFEVWRTGISTPDNPADDVRLVPAGLDINGDGVWGVTGDDHPASGGSNDPQTDWTYWYLPSDMAPGESGYLAWLSNLINTGDPYAHGGEVIGRIVFMNWNGGSPPGPYNSDMPEAGSVFRISTTKPNQPGDSFSMSTDGLGARGRDDAEQKAALDNIGIVPNPYKGASSYEVTALVDQVRFTNMPNQATIRVFTLAGTLVRTLEKNSAGAMFPWDLSTTDGLPLASGMYIIHIDVPNVGEKVLKFGVIKKRVQLNAF